MEGEASAFETSEMVATLVASTPLVRESWRLCNLANTNAPASFVMEQVGHVGYLAFSGIQNQALKAMSDGNLVELAEEGVAKELFGPLLQNSCHNNQDDKKNSVMIHQGLLHLFLSLCHSQTFRSQLQALIESSKSIVITGHSLGGTTASLSALWLLSHLQSVSSSLPVLCITFGSPLLGNESLSRAILRERWGGNFCHVVSKYDIVPRLLFAPIAPHTPQLHLLLQYWHLSISSPPSLAFVHQLSDQDKAQLLDFVMACLEDCSRKAGEEEEAGESLFWPFGNYLFCSQEGVICLDNAASVIKMMHLMLMSSSPNQCIDDHLKYGDYVGQISSQFLKQRSFARGELPQSSYEAGLALALQSSGISSMEPAAAPAKDCLMIARRSGTILTPGLKCADLAIKLSKINPYRAQIEWYKALCDESEEQMGYYDAFKQRGSSKRGDQVNMNRHKLGGFWNGVINMLENNELPYDFHLRAKWVNGSQSYKLLVEPLDIAEYYRKGRHRTEGHYLNNGRPRRYQIFDRWWKEREVKGEENTMRSTYAGLTQDSCFWAKVEEALDWLANLHNENDASKRALLLEKINKFETYARRLVERKEVSKDVVAENSSYTKWIQELSNLRSPLVFPVSPLN
ncbi:hypothetical protein UlMin_044134 [Ulmus minor]